MSSKALHEAGNKAIAEFMGGFMKDVYWGGKKTTSFYLPTSDITQPISDFELQTPYHTSWDWLMPVVEKIEALGFFTRIVNLNKEEHVCEIMDWLDKGISYHKDASKITAVWLAITTFINWYKTQK